MAADVTKLIAKLTQAQRKALKNASEWGQIDCRKSTGLALERLGCAVGDRQDVRVRESGTAGATWTRRALAIDFRITELGRKVQEAL